MTTVSPAMKTPKAALHHLTRRRIARPAGEMEAYVYLLVEDTSVTYVGQSGSPLIRQLQHRADGKTFDEQYCIRVPRSRVNEYERALIRFFAPPMNVADTGPLRDRDYRCLAELGITEGGEEPEPEDLAAAYAEARARIRELEDEMERISFKHAMVESAARAIQQEVERITSVLKYG